MRDHRWTICGLAMSIGSLAISSLLAIATFAQSSIASTNQPPPVPILRAERIELVDSNGGIIARLGKRDDGSVALDFLDQAKQPRATIALLSDGTPGILLTHAQGGAIAIGRDPAQQAMGWAIADSSNQFRITATLLADQTAFLSFSDSAHNPRLALGIQADGMPKLYVLDPQQQPVWSAP
jgi:hypothetical protein